LICVKEGYAADVYNPPHLPLDDFCLVPQIFGGQISPVATSDGKFVPLFQEGAPDPSPACDVLGH